MPKARSPNRDKAYEMWAGSGGTRSLRSIAGELGIPEKTVSAWKAKDKWEEKKNGVLHTDKRSTPNIAEYSNRKARGAQPGNKNARGNHGGAPLGSANALKHGFYWDALTAEEQSLLEERQEPTDEERLLSELHLWEVRERRLLQSIAEQRAVASGLAVDNVMRTGNKTTTTAISTAENIRRLESLLTAAQRAHLRCIESLRELKRADGGEGDGNMDQLIESLAAAREMWGDKE